MLAISNRGRLGNQLFMYKAAQVLNLLNPNQKLVNVSFDVFRPLMGHGILPVLPYLNVDAVFAEVFDATKILNPGYCRKDLVIECYSFVSSQMIDIFSSVYRLTPERGVRSGCLVHVRLGDVFGRLKATLPLEYYIKAGRAANSDDYYIATDSPKSGIVAKLRVELGARILCMNPLETLKAAAGAQAVVCSGGSFSLWCALQCRKSVFIPSLRLVNTIKKWYDPYWFYAKTIAATEVDV